jgi:glutamate-1-semialdehyde 2,1-aminomutase
VELAAHLVERVPSIDLVRFCNSGTEATLNAVRVARAATGRHLIAKAEGGYHGSADDVFVSTHPDPESAGPAERPEPVPRAPGLGRSARTDTVVIPFNRPEAAAARLREAGEDLAAVLFEPVMGSAGMIPAVQEYVAVLREVTEELGAVLVADEVVTFRLAHGGVEEWLGIRPDLTCLGKMIGGGLPLGAFGGRRDLMALFDPTDGPVVGHPGSLNANPLCLVAGLAALTALTPERIEELNARGDDLRMGLRRLADKHGFPLTVTGFGSLLALHVTPGPVREFRDTWTVDRELAHALFLGLLTEGVVIDPRGAVCLSTATTDADLTDFLLAFGRVAERLVG